MLGRIIRVLRARRRPPCRDTWHPGDLGICILCRWAPAHDFDPKLDDLIRVSSVGRDRRGTVFLRLVGKPQQWRWEASAFRKIVPTHEQASEEFAATIRKAAKAPAPVVAE